uniref:Reverse transcriptase zinc-binding domain-containing protein n=1 Tax=Chenopodium quinoa TaxID=63459 RepID=A0A803MRY4_CHEQI
MRIGVAFFLGLITDLPLNTRRSDHAPLILRAGVREENRRQKKLFRFEAYWLSSPECEAVVKEGWTLTTEGHTPFKVAMCAAKLESWTSITFGNVKKKIKEAEEKLVNLQRGVMGGVALERCRTVSEELDNLHLFEEFYWHARARVNELKDGDRNTSYFHHKASMRKSKNNITGIENADGVRVHGRKDIEGVITNYFTGLFTSEGVENIVEALSDGIYTVKSAYWLGILGLRTLHNTGSAENWRYIWKINGPQKMKHFIWKACSKSMAVNSELHRRHIIEDNYCQRCREDVETVTHAIFKCPTVRSVWENSSFWEEVQQIGEESFEVFKRVTEHYSHHDVYTFSALAWAMWTSRNKALFENSPHDPILLATGFSKYVSDFQVYSAKVFGGRRGNGGISNSTWKKPPAGTLKINVDAATFDDAVGLGVVARNSHGDIVFTGARRWRGRWDSCIAEAAAIHFGVELAIRFGEAKKLGKDPIVEGDHHSDEDSHSYYDENDSGRISLSEMNEEEDEGVHTSTRSPTSSPRAITYGGELGFHRDA